MVYVDTSIVLAWLLGEDRRPPATLWSETLVSSRLLEYELWTRVHARGLGESHSEAAREILARLSFFELSPVVLERALTPWPVPLRTLDSMHLATAHYVRTLRQQVEFASYDLRQLEAARALGIPLYPA